MQNQTHFFAELPDKPAISATVLPQLDLFLYSGNFADQDIPQPDFVAFIYGHAGVNFVHFNAKAALWPLGDSFIVPLLDKSAWARLACPHKGPKNPNRRTRQPENALAFAPIFRLDPEIWGKFAIVLPGVGQIQDP